MRKLFSNVIIIALLLSLSSCHAGADSEKTSVSTKDPLQSAAESMMTKKSFETESITEESFAEAKTEESTIETKTRASTTEVKPKTSTKTGS